MQFLKIKLLILYWSLEQGHILNNRSTILIGAYETEEQHSPLCQVSEIETKFTNNLQDNTFVWIHAFHRTKLQVFLLFTKMEDGEKTSI